MRVNLYYAPFPSQTFDGEERPVSTVRVFNPKSALVTLAAGVRRHLSASGIDAELRIIDTQIEGDATYYKSISYGPRTLDCYRIGGQFEKYDDAIRMADIHGISNNFTNSAGIVLAFARHVKAVNPEALLVAGGMDATARPEYYIDNGFDVVVQLEGEQMLAKIIEAHALRIPLREAVPHRAHRGGTIVVASSLVNLEELPPMSLDLVEDLHVYTDTGEGVPPPTVKTPFSCFETSRGCYRTCSFCATPMRGKYRYMSPAAVEKHFAYFKEIGVKNLLFQEDNILSRMQRTGRGRLLHDKGRGEILEIFQMARDHGFSWEFANGLEFGKFLDEGKVDTELMKVLFWSERTADRWRGCYRVQIPLEFLGEDPSRKFNKLRTFHEELEILEAMLDYDVHYQTFNVIIGHEGDDHDAIDTYLDRCVRLKTALCDRSSRVVPYFNVFNRTLLPGTKDFQLQHAQLAFDIERDPEIISVYLAPMNTARLSYYELVEHRLRLTRELNGSLVDQYDGIQYAPLAPVSEPRGSRSRPAAPTDLNAEIESGVLP
jgi:radical SAM superfamily enzyme YgiQ (UPF0313 family)